MPDTCVGHSKKSAIARAPNVPSADADRAADQAEDHRLDQELPQHVAASRADGLRSPISRVRSVTDTSMMFMIPMPPTSSETDATAASSTSIVCVDCFDRLGDLGRMPQVEVVVGPRPDVMARRAAARRCPASA